LLFLYKETRNDINYGKNFVLLTQKEKEELVRSLLEKGYTIRKISEQAHVSFGFISEIKRKITGEGREKGIKKN
jgi:DNA invertase Pin-like site-specific DNA recombinase